MSDIARVAAFVALIGGVLALFAGLSVLVLAQFLSGTAVANPTAALSSVFTLAAVGAAIGLAYGLVAGVVVAIARRIAGPGRGVIAAAIVFALGMSGIIEGSLSLVFGAAALPRLDASTSLFVRGIGASLVALITWQEVRQRETTAIAAVGQAGRSQRR